jgi:hypothetical protein
MRFVFLSHADLQVVCFYFFRSITCKTKKVELSMRADADMMMNES